METRRMLCCKWMRRVVLLGALALAAPAVPAQEPVPAPNPPTSSEALLKRLEEAEARLKSLEAELKAVPTLEDQTPMSAGAAADDKKDGKKDDKKTPTIPDL